MASNAPEYKPHTNGQKSQWWVGVATAVVAAGAVPMASGYVAINRLADQNAQEVKYLTARIAQLEADRSRLDGRAEANRASIIELSGRVDGLLLRDNPRVNGLEIGLAGLSREFSIAQEGTKHRFDGIISILSDLQRLITAAIEVHNNNEDKERRSR